MFRLRFALALIAALVWLSAAVRPLPAAGQPACDPAAPVELVSIGIDGLPVNSISLSSISADGRYIAFGEVLETNQYNAPTRTQVLVRDRVNCQSEVVSVASDETPLEVNYAISFISDDGRYVVFEGAFVEQDHHLYQRDRLLGTTTRVSILPDGSDSNCVAIPLDMTGDGRYLLFIGIYDAACFSVDDPQRIQLYVRDMQLNVTERVTTALDGQPARFNQGRFGQGIRSGVISEDGARVLFSAYDSDMVVGDTNGFSDVFLSQRETGQITRITHAYDGGQPNGGSLVSVQSIPSFPYYYAFVSDASNLVPGDSNGVSDVFLFNADTGVLERLPLNLNGVDQPSLLISISADARFVLHSIDNSYDSYIQDRQTGSLFDLSSHPHANPTGSMNLWNAQLSADGQSVVYGLSSYGKNWQQWGELRVARWQSLTPGLIAPPAPPQPIYPISEPLNLQRAFDWNTVRGATWYYVWITGENGHVLDQWVNPICYGSCSSSFPLNHLPPGSYRWWVQAWSPQGGYGAWNSGADFIITTPPAAPTLIPPTQVSAGDQPTYSWNAVPGATWYYLWVSDESGYVLDQWYDGYPICAGGLCSVTPPVPVEGGLHRFWVQAWSRYGGYSLWSGEASFGAAPAAPTPLAPVGAQQGIVSFHWSSVQGGAWYYVWLSGEAGHVWDAWFEAASVCDGGNCHTDMLWLPPGAYRWWVQAWSPHGGYGAWSGQTDFSLPESIAPPADEPPADELPASEPPPVLDVPISTETPPDSTPEAP